MTLFLLRMIVSKTKRKPIVRQSVNPARHSVMSLIVNKLSFRQMASGFRETPGVWQAQKRPGETS